MSQIDLPPSRAPEWRRWQSGLFGIFNLLNTARTAATDPLWLGFYTESYVFTAVIYFAICFSGSCYSLWLEQHLGRSLKR